MRQVVLGAVIAFAVTVAVFSFMSPKPVPAPGPAPIPVAAAVVDAGVARSEALRPVGAFNMHVPVLRAHPLKASAFAALDDAGSK